MTPSPHTNGSALQQQRDYERKERNAVAFYACVFCLTVLAVVSATEPHLMFEYVTEGSHHGF